MCVCFFLGGEFLAVVIVYNIPYMKLKPIFLLDALKCLGFRVFNGGAPQSVPKGFSGGVQARSFPRHPATPAGKLAASFRLYSTNNNPTGRLNTKLNAETAKNHNPKTTITPLSPSKPGSTKRSLALAPTFLEKRICKYR